MEGYFVSGQTTIKRQVAVVVATFFSLFLFLTTGQVIKTVPLIPIFLFRFSFSSALVYLFS